MQGAPDGAAVNVDAMDLGQFHGQFVERDLTPGGDAGLDPTGYARQLAMPAAIPLPPWCQRPGFAAQLDQLVDEFRRQPEVPRRLAVPVTLVYIRDNPRSELYRMWFAHR
ncbi:hypothetical protein [Maliponia aquimaris]|uniref:hypothetical protein n=1 Tax=Maliponia aquimaris TaxID=1673631 RepID=UPI001FE8473A|nr:hypothetical protein [Maliponia aquimaris]